MSLPSILARMWPGLDQSRARARLPDLKVPDFRVLAQDKVLFVGHAIAAVVATDRYAARDAVDLVAVDYEELPW